MTHGKLTQLLFGMALAATLMTTSSAVRSQDDWDDDWDDEESLPVEIHGFVEGAGSARVMDDPAASNDILLGEARFRLDMAHYGDRANLSFKGDFVSDAVTSETVIDIRQAWLSMRASSWLDVRFGRMVLTWGTGDLLFLNDLFPKDFESFFIGRDDEFLKAPSNTLRLTAYSRAVNLDVAWTPVFTPDRYITGERMSFYDPMRGSIVGPDSSGVPFEAATPDKTIENSELAGRLYRTISGYEVAAYGYTGFYNRPLAYDTTAMAATFSRLAVGGASVRGNALGGIFNVEGAYYLSRDDRDGTDPLVPNSQTRGLAGYERELVARLTLGLQYYLEHTADYDRLIDASPSPQTESRETRQILTTRLTWRLQQETLILSLFGFVALEDGDTHWRPSVTRQWTDNVTVAVGANVMTGDDHTFFGQLENNTNIYLRLRYSF